MYLLHDYTFIFDNNFVKSDNYGSTKGIGQALWAFSSILHAWGLGNVEVVGY